jgi:hypothetical protein
MYYYSLQIKLGFKNKQKKYMNRARNTKWKGHVGFNEARSEPETPLAS